MLDNRELEYNQSPELTDLDTGRLRTFLTLAEELHFGRTADRLDQSPSSLSRSITVLEDAIGARLFLRDSRNVQLTEAGRALIPRVREILRLIEGSIVDARRLSTGFGQSVRLGYAGPASISLVGQLVKEVSAAQQGVRLLVEGSSYTGNAIQDLVDEKLDIALVRWATTPAGLDWIKVDVEDLGVACNINECECGDEPVPLQHFSDREFVLMSSKGSVLIEAFLGIANKQGFRPKISQIASDPWTAAALVSAGGTVMPSVFYNSPAIQFPQLRTVPLVEGKGLLTLALAWRQGDENPALHKVIEVARRLI